MDATEVFSKITYLEEGMKKLLAQKAVSSEEIQQLLEAVEAKANPTINFNAEAVADGLAPKLVAKIPALNVTALAKQLGPVLMTEMPTPVTLHQAGSELLAKINGEYRGLGKQVQSFLAAISTCLDTMEQRVGATVDKVPKTVGLDAFYDARVSLLVFGMPFICLVSLFIYSSFFRVPQAQYEGLEAQHVLLQQKNVQLQAESDRMTDAGIFYLNQIKAYKRKFPKSAGYFRTYRPAPPTPTTAPAPAPAVAPPMLVVR